MEFFMLEHFPRIRGLGCRRGSGAPGTPLSQDRWFFFKQR